MPQSAFFIIDCERSNRSAVLRAIQTSKKRQFLIQTVSESQGEIQRKKEKLISTVSPSDETRYRDGM